MKPFHESLRYEYALSPGSYVIDLGAYHGHWSAEMSRRYGCQIDAYEPVFQQEALATLSPFPNVTLVGRAVGVAERRAQFGIKGDMTGEFTQGEKTKEVSVVPLESTLRRYTVDLIKINIEGGEYSFLEDLIERGLARRFRNIQVQFHTNVPDALPRWINIFERLLTTHDVTYMKPFCWENYQLR